MNVQKILVVAAHPDDEVLGCGATIARHCAQGDEVRILFMADGVGARDPDSMSQSVLRQQAAAAAMNILGVKSWRCLALRDNALDAYPLLELIKPIESYLQEFPAEIIYTHHGGDLNIDHQLTYRAVLTACRPQPKHCVKQIYTFEVQSSTEWAAGNTVAFRPDYFVNVIQSWEKKIAALRCYDTEMRDYPHARSLQAVDALSVWRGASVGVARAEAFKLERALWL